MKKLNLSLYDAREEILEEPVRKDARQHYNPNTVGRKSLKDFASRKRIKLGTIAGKVTLPILERSDNSNAPAAAATYEPNQFLHR